MAVKVQTLPPVTVASAGTAVAVGSTAIAVTSLTIQAEDDNTGSLFIGDATVSSTNGLELVPGATAEITADSIGRGQSEEFYINEIYVNATTSGDTARAAAFRRR